MDFFTTPLFYLLAEDILFTYCQRNKSILFCRLWVLRVSRYQRSQWYSWLCLGVSLDYNHVVINPARIPQVSNLEFYWFMLSNDNRRDAIKLRMGILREERKYVYVFRKMNWTFWILENCSPTLTIIIFVVA